jgi:hypothetical protein
LNASIADAFYLAANIWFLAVNVCFPAANSLCKKLLKRYFRCGMIQVLFAFGDTTLIVHPLQKISNHPMLVGRFDFDFTVFTPNLFNRPMENQTRNRRDFG